MSEASMAAARQERRVGRSARSRPLSVVLIWASWLVSTRHSVGTALTPLDLSLIRYGSACAGAGAGLAAHRALAEEHAEIAAGADDDRDPVLLFFQVVAFGMRHTPASAAGVLLLPAFDAVFHRADRHAGAGRTARCRPQVRHGLDPRRRLDPACRKPHRPRTFLGQLCRAADRRDPAGQSTRMPSSSRD